MKSAIIALADMFNKKVVVEVKGIKLELDPEEASKLANALFDAKYKIELENIP
jgi:hypothetical protein